MVRPMKTTTPAHGPRFVSYIRVSTAKQGVSGLGLEAQRAAVAQHVAAKGGELLSEYQEVESGKRATNRPQLRAALRAAADQGATLIVAKLDRLARNVRFLAELMDSDVDFIALDLPGANRFTLHVMAAVAEQEARATSERTVAALKAAKARGVKLGKPENLTAYARQKATDAHRAAVRDRYRIVAPLVLALHRSGMSLGQIASRLNELRAELARGGSKWQPMQVKRVLAYATRTE